MASQVPAATPSKMALAMDWYANHPEDRHRPGRELEAAVRPMGVQISYKTWNDAKRALD